MAEPSAGTIACTDTGPLFHPMMQKALERALGHAEYIIENAQKRPPKRKYSSSGQKSLHEKLYDIYVEECGKEPEVTEELRSNVNLLEKLVTRESLSCLVVNLYPGKEGYSLMVKGKNGTYSETIRLPYEEGELLEYLDAEELPPVLVDPLEKCPVNMFHCGCVIAEIRDYRQSSNREAPGYQSRHILLRPTMQTLACDVESIASDNRKWTQEDKLLLESQLILATAEPLCLEPSVSVACTENRLLYNKQKMNTCPMRRSFKRYSAASLSRQQELPRRPPPPELRVSPAYKESMESEAGQQNDLKIPKAGNCVDTWKQRPCDLAVPSEVDVEKYAEGEWSVQHDDYSQLTVWPADEVYDDSIFGNEDWSQTTNLTFPQLLNDPFISGIRSSPKKVRCEREISSSNFPTYDHSNSSMPGSKTDVGKVVSLSKKSVKKTTKRPVKMSHRRGGSAGFRKIFPKKKAEQRQVGSVQSSALGKEVKQQPPATKLPLSSQKSSSGNRYAPQQARSFHKRRYRPIACKPPSLAQKSSVEVNLASTLPVASMFTASSALGALVSQVKATSAGLQFFQVVDPLVGTQTVVRCSNPVQCSTVGAGESPGVNLSRLPSGGQPPNAQSTAPRAPSQTGVRYSLEPASDLRPLTLLQVPQSSVILNTQQQTQWPQQCQQQRVYQLVPQQQPQQTTIFHLQQPVVLQSSSAQISTSQVTILPAQQVVFINLSGVGSFVQPQATVLSVQTEPRQAIPQQMVLLSPALQQQPQPQQVQLRMVQRPEPVATAAAQTAQPQCWPASASREQAS